MKFQQYLAMGTFVIFAAECFPQQTAPAAAQAPQVIFSRSQSDTQQKPAMPAAHPPAGKVTDAERNAITFTAYDLEVHLSPRQQAIAVEARVTVRNEGQAPLTFVPLQLSSSLNFEQVAQHGRALPFSQQTIESDVDHTGQLHEAAAMLTSPLQPGQQIALTVTYSGSIVQTAKRLDRIGTPEDLAHDSDWDVISEDFTGLRGFGDTVWYPASSAPVLLGDGARLFTEIGEQKQRSSAATVKMRVTDEFLGDAPDFAAIDGQTIKLGAPRVMPSASFPGVLTFSIDATTLGFAPISLFVAQRGERQGDGLRVFARDTDQADAQGYLTAATMVAPFVATWLGQQRQPLTVLDLPEPLDAAFESGPLLATGLQPLAPEKLTSPVIQGLAHAGFLSPRPWLAEGVPLFLGTLWIEKTMGRNAALERLEAERSALAVAEPATPQTAAGEPLIEATDAIYYGTKSAYVLWMLRDLVGDKALSSALESYDPALDTQPGYFQRLVESAAAKYPEANAAGPNTPGHPDEKGSGMVDLRWFFNDWVYRDRGLPDLSIANVYSSNSSQANTFLVAVDVTNDGYAAASVPVTVRSQNASQTERMIVPARSKVTHRMLIQGEPTEVQVNDGVVPEVQASIHRRLITAAGEG